MALICGIVEATRWLDEGPENRLQAARLLAGETYLNLPVEVIAASLTGQLTIDQRHTRRELADFHVFYRYAANFPWRSHALWMLRQMVRWGQLPAGADLLAAAHAVYRPDIYRLAVARLGVPLPAVDMKAEGGHRGGWKLGEGTAAVALGADRFIDGAVFDPADSGAKLA
jgi:nitrate/nitrite transport system substrate-binding protein